MNNSELYNEHELLLQISDGNEQAFIVLCRHYTPMLYTVIFRLINERWIAEEIVQDVFLKIWLKRANLPTIKNFGGWIFKIAANQTFNANKRIQKEKASGMFLEGSFANYELTSNDITKEEMDYLKLLEEAINSLSARQQETYNLIKGEGLSRNEAAARMNVSPETVKTNMERAFRSIRAYCITRMDKTSFFVIFCLIYTDYFF